MNVDGPVLVVGATGQLGARVVQLLTARDVPTRALVRATSDVGSLRRQHVELAYGCLDDVDSLVGACAGASAVIATASSIVPTTGDAFGERDVSWYTNLTRACVEKGVERIIYVSAFTTPHDDQVPEFRIKREIEQIIIESGLGYSIFRSAAFMDVYFAVMGSSIPLAGVAHPTLNRAFWATRLFRRLTAQLIECHGVALVPGDGTTRHAFISVDNVAEFLVNALDDRDARALICDIGGPHAVCWAEVAALFAEVTGCHVKTVRLPIGLLDSLQRNLSRLSPGAGNLIAILKLIGSVDYTHDSSAIANRFGVRLTGTKHFLESRAMACLSRQDAAHR